MISDDEKIKAKMESAANVIWQETIEQYVREYEEYERQISIVNEFCFKTGLHKAGKVLCVAATRLGLAAAEQLEEKKEV